MRRIFNSWRFALSAAVLFFAGYAVRANFFPEESNFSSTTVDFGIIASDVAKSVEWYKTVVGCQERDGFDVPGEFAANIGLTANLPFHVHVLTLGEGASATKIKLMGFESKPGARVDNSYIHSSYGIRYLTIFVKDLNKSLEQAAAHGAKPIAKGTHPLPPGFPEGLGIAVLRDPDGNFVELVGPWKK